MSGAEGRARRIVLVLFACQLAAVVALALAGAARDAGTDGKASADRDAVHRLAAELRLTGLALWSDASYCRFPAQADLFAPHAEHPVAPEHSPAGSIVPPRVADGAVRGERPPPRGTGGP